MDADSFVEHLSLTHPVIDDPGAELAIEGYAPAASPYIPAMTLLNRRHEVVAWHWMQLDEAFLDDVMAEPFPETDYLPVNYLPVNYLPE